MRKGVDHGNRWNHMELYGNIWNCMEMYENVWNHMESYGIVWNCIEFYGVKKPRYIHSTLYWWCSVANSWLLPDGIWYMPSCHHCCCCDHLSMIFLSCLAIPHAPCGKNTMTDIDINVDNICSIFQDISWCLSQWYWHVNGVFLRSLSHVPSEISHRQHLAAPRSPRSNSCSRGHRCPRVGKRMKNGRILSWEVQWFLISMLISNNLELKDDFSHLKSWTFCKG